MAKLYDLAVKTGTFTNRNGEEKGRWKNIGAVIETKDGGKVILMDRTFNPAGVPVEEGRDQIMFSMFVPKDDQDQQGQGQQQQQQAPRPQQRQQSADDLTDDIPF
jgi:hypothetical protein